MIVGLLAVAQGLLLIGIAPLIQGMVNKVKAGLQGRIGPPILQPYYDLRKFWKKDQVVSNHASWLFLITPYLVFAATVIACGMVPVVMTQTLLTMAGGLFVLIYLFGLTRFFTALSGIDTGSSFGAMGSSRDMFVSGLAEPALFVALLAVALPVKTISLSRITQVTAENHASLLNPAFYLVFVALFILVLTESGRIPVDNPDTHLELTMIHEGMLLEYSGRRLALMMWSAWIRQVLLFALLIDVCLPWGVSTRLSVDSVTMGIGWFLLKVLVIASVVGIVEMSNAKMRLYRIPRLLSAAFTLSVLAIATDTLH